MNKTSNIGNKPSEKSMFVRSLDTIVKLIRADEVRQIPRASLAVETNREKMFKKVI